MKCKTFISAFALVLSVSFVLTNFNALARGEEEITKLITDLASKKIAQTEGTDPALQPNAQSCIHVLWDLTHGDHYNFYNPYNAYTTLRTILVSLGCDVQTTTNLLSVDLQRNYDLLIIHVGAAWNSSYTAAEANLIESFVRNAGTLLIFGDYSTYPVHHINPVSSRFGITFNSTAPGGYTTSFHFENHPILNGVNHLTFLNGCNLTVRSPASIITFYVTHVGGWWLHLPAVAVVEHGRGRVVAVGDGNFCDNWRIGMTDNRRFTENIFGWLKGTVGPGERPTWINVTYPNGGETWYVGRNYTIRWQSDRYVGKVYVEFHRAGGGWYNVAPWDGTDNDGSFTYRPNGSDVSEQCWFRVRFRDDASIADVSNRPFRIRWGGLAKGNAPESSMPTEFKLHQNHPNPFNPETTIDYQLPYSANVKLSIYNLQGQKINELINATKSAGTHSVLWNGRNELGQLVASGLYFYRIEAVPLEGGQQPFVEVKKMNLMK